MNPVKRDVRIQNNRIMRNQLIKNYEIHYEIRVVR